MIQIALLGFGVVGSGTAEVLTKNRSLIEKHSGKQIEIKYILDLRDFPDHPLGNRVVHDFNLILNDPEVSVVAEMMGGSHPAYEFTKAALEAGKHVVTSNKEVVANFGAELLDIARQHGVNYLFEASVGGGIPIIRPLQTDLAPDNILSVSGILNGTTNYILSKMKNDGAEFADALREAREKGYAEADPTADIEGLDAARKIVILCALAFGVLIPPSEIEVEGITKITSDQVAVAESLGCAVKLIGHTERIGDRVLAMVGPHLVPASNPIHHVEDVFNGILVNSDPLGKTFFYGAGAGKLPTAGAIVSDLLNATSADLVLPVWKCAEKNEIASSKDRRVRRAFVLPGCAKCAEKAKPVFGFEQYVVQEGSFAFLSKPMTGGEVENALRELGKEPVWTLPVLD